MDEAAIAALEVKWPELADLTVATRVVEACRALEGRDGAWTDPGLVERVYLAWRPDARPRPLPPSGVSASLSLGRPS